MYQIRRRHTKCVVDFGQANNPRRPCPFRVERMRLELQGFSFKVKYRSGKLNPADYTSRHQLPLSQCSREDLKSSAELEAHLNWVVTNEIPPSLTLKEIRTGYSYAM